MAKPPLNGVAETEYTKSHLRGFSILLKIFFRVHEFVVRAMRGECVRHRIKQKSAVLPLSMVSSIPRVRTYHTRKPSRFVHALSARPLKVHWRGLTHMRSMCVNSLDDPRGRGEHCSPAKNHKVTFLLSRFLVTKSAAKVIKESVPLSLRALPPPVSATPTNALRALVNSRGVHELVARAMRGECVRQRIK